MPACTPAQDAALVYGLPVAVCCCLHHCLSPPLSPLLPAGPDIVRLERLLLWMHLLLLLWMHLLLLLLLLLLLRSS